MKKLIILFIIVNNFIFCEIIDDSNFLSIKNFELISNSINEVKKYKDIDVDIILLDSKIIVDEISFYNKKKSVFILLKHDNNYINDINIYTSSDLFISKKDNLHLIEMSKEFIRLNHYTDEGLFIISLIEILKKMNIQNDKYFVFFLRNNIQIILVVSLFIFLLILKFLLNFKTIKNKFNIRNI